MFSTLKKRLSMILTVLLTVAIGVVTLQCCNTAEAFYPQPQLACCHNNVSNKPGRGLHKQVGHYKQQIHKNCGNCCVSNRYNNVLTNRYSAPGFVQIAPSSYRAYQTPYNSLTNTVIDLLTRQAIPNQRYRYLTLQKLRN